VSTDRPEPGAELHGGPATVPRLAATVILLRGGDQGLEVLLAQRTPTARFMGGAWVFPGGAVGKQDGDGDAALRAAAIRELREEAGIELGKPEELVPFSRWITPAVVKIRYDTWFFLAPVPDGAEPVIDGEEMIDARWYAPADALAASRNGEIMLVFPTIKHLEQLSTFSSAQHLLRHARSSTVAPVEPRVIRQGETARIVLPGEPGYDP
jgi:8-oxo-dGTP pyrophosphatase MutT (NUDIX family)